MSYDKFPLYVTHEQVEIIVFSKSLEIEPGNFDPEHVLTFVSCKQKHKAQ